MNRLFKSAKDAILRKFGTSHHSVTSHHIVTSPRPSIVHPLLKELGTYYAGLKLALCYLQSIDAQLKIIPGGPKKHPEILHGVMQQSR